MCGKRWKECSLFCLAIYWLSDRLRRLAGTLMSPSLYVTDTHPAMAWCISLTLRQALNLRPDVSLFMPMLCCFVLILITELKFFKCLREVLAHPDTYLSGPTSCVLKCLLAFCILPGEGGWPSSYAVRYSYRPFKVQFTTCLICLLFTERCSLSWCLTLKVAGTELIGQECQKTAVTSRVEIVRENWWAWNCNWLSCAWRLSHF